MNKELYNIYVKMRKITKEKYNVFFSYEELFNEY